MERLFDLDMQLVHDTILLAIAVFFLFLAMSYLLFNPVRKMLEDRKLKIRTELDDAAADKADAAALKVQYEEKLKDISWKNPPGNMVVQDFGVFAASANGNLSGHSPSILLAQKRSVTQTPRRGVCC